MSSTEDLGDDLARSHASLDGEVSVGSRACCQQVQISPVSFTRSEEIEVTPLLRSDTLIVTL